MAPELAKERQAIDAASAAACRRHPTTLVMAERPPENPRPTFIHNRGEFSSRRSASSRRALGSCHRFPRNRGADRLASRPLAGSPANPLVGRVTMNRQWAAFFGRGIVPTLEDFGYQGEPPSHPELLDWLALECTRRMVDEADAPADRHERTYQQSSRVPPVLLAKDPEIVCWLAVRASVSRPRWSATACCGRAGC